MSIPADSHVHTVWRVAMDTLDPDDHLAGLARDSQLHPPSFDATGNLHEVEECHDRYSDLRILSGLELGEPHRHREAVAEVLASGAFDRVLGSLHSLADGAEYCEPTWRAECAVSRAHRGGRCDPEAL
ncbi:MAG: hypothetical protein LH477_02460 [Nocardioides sp.]|nr:hypothetical protein [Nocardioides sp.]